MKSARKPPVVANRQRPGGIPLDVRWRAPTTDGTGDVAALLAACRGPGPLRQHPVDYGVGAIATAPPGLWIKDSTFALWRLIKPISEYPAAIRVSPSGVMAMA